MLGYIARKILPSSVKDVLQVYRPLQLSSQIVALGIVESGINADDLPYVKLNTGRTFHGFRPSGLEKFIYKYIITNAAKKNLSEHSFRIALDIIYRYRRSESSSLSSGKFYAFQPGDTVVECGAYLGYFSMKASEIVGESGRIIAIEPIEENLKFLRENVRVNGFENITIVPKGIWNMPQQMKIFREKRQRASLVSNIVEENEHLPISCDSVDNILSGLNVESVDFIRIQLNGAEMEALEGMKKTLPVTRRILVSALYKRDGRYAYQIVHEILTKNGFSTQVANGNVLGFRE